MVFPGPTPCATVIRLIRFSSHSESGGGGSDGGSRQSVLLSLRPRKPARPASVAFGLFFNRLEDRLDNQTDTDPTPSILPSRSR